MTLDPSSLRDLSQRDDTLTWPDGAEQLPFVARPRDQYSVVYRAVLQEYERLTAPDVAYMENVDPAGSFSCGTCVFADRAAAFCRHPKVNAPVSPEHGCCNLWKGNAGATVFPVSP